MYGIINDIIVFPNGTVRLDWNENAPSIIDYGTESNKSEDDASLVSLKKTDLWNAFEKTVGKERTEKDVKKAIYDGFQNTVKQNQSQCKYDDGWNDMIRIANINRILEKSREHEDTYSCGGVSIRRSSC